MNDNEIIKAPVVEAGDVSQADELKLLLEPIVAACFLAKANAMIIGDPGWGKTEIVEYMQRQVWDGKSINLSCVPTTMPADLMGYKNPIHAIDPEAEAKGIPFWVTRGTPVEEGVESCLLDDITRLGDQGADALIHTMHAISRYHRPTYLATSNWLQPTPRNAALRDRFTFTVFYVASPVDVNALIHKNAISEWEFDLPTASQVYEVRAWLDEYVKSDPSSYKCTRVITDLLESIARVCAQDVSGFVINNRHVFNMRAVLYAMGCYYAGSNDFETLPEQAYAMLAYAYPVIDIGQSLKWQAIVMATKDVVETEIAQFKSNAYQEWRALRAQHADRHGNLSTEQLDAMSRSLGKIWQTSEQELKTRFPNDPRVRQALKEMFSIYKKLIRGEKID